MTIPLTAAITMMPPSRELVLGISASTNQAKSTDKIVSKGTTNMNSAARICRDATTKSE